MRILKWLFGIVVALAIVFFGGAFLLPKNVEVARAVEIDAPASDIFPYLNSLKAAGEWSPWLGRDPEVQLTYSGPEEGVGAKLEWASEHPQVGEGVQEITLSDPGKRVETALDFGPMGSALAAFDLVEAGGKTTVTWGFETDLGNNPMGRWMGLMMDRWVGGDYEAGLSNLKSLVEG
jgi:hypothetical protein